MDLYTFICATQEIAQEAESTVKGYWSENNTSYIHNPHYICSQVYQVDDCYRLEIAATESLVNKFDGLFTAEELRWSGLYTLHIKMKPPTTKSQPNLVARITRNR